MKAAVLESVNKFVVKEIATPKPTKDLVLVKVKACGVCLTDYKAFSGERTNVNFPTIPGHEFSGIIESIGEQVTYFHPGDEVIVITVKSCGICINCRNGLSHYCERGIVIGGDGQPTVMDGGFAEFCLVPESTLYTKPKNISFEAAALTEPLAGSYKGIIEYSGFKIGESIVIIGAGGMGLLVLMIAAKTGGGHIIVIDVDDWRLDLAKKLGATHIINSSKIDAKSEVYKIIPQGPDLVFEAAGPVQTFDLAYTLCRRGTRINEFGVTTEGKSAVSPGEIHFKEIRIDASFSVTPKVMQKSIQLQELGLIDASKIITHHFQLDQIDDAMQMMKKTGRVKVMIIPNP